MEGGPLLLEWKPLNNELMKNDDFPKISYLCMKGVREKENGEAVDHNCCSNSEKLTGDEDGNLAGRKNV